MVMCRKVHDLSAADAMRAVSAPMQQALTNMYDDVCKYPYHAALSL